MHTEFRSGLATIAFVASVAFACLDADARAVQNASGRAANGQTTNGRTTQQTTTRQNTGQADAPATPQKSNRRPAANARTKGEPYDAATPAEMKELCVTLQTSAGEIEIEMLAETAPDTARNFLNLVATGAFDTTTFSRVVKGFVIQGGDLTTRAQMTPALLERASRRIHDEPNPVKHVRGIVSMARAAEPDSATTNFFILAGDAAHLDGTFAAFGRVRRGMDVVDKINNAPAEGERPKEPVRITRAIVARCPPPAATPAPAP